MSTLQAITILVQGVSIDVISKTINYSFQNMHTFRLEFVINMAVTMKSNMV
jgi:hypothetical protein